MQIPSFMSRQLHSCFRRSLNPDDFDFSTAHHARLRMRVCTKNDSFETVSGPSAAGAEHAAESAADQARQSAASSNPVASSETGSVGFHRSEPLRPPWIRVKSHWASRRRSLRALSSVLLFIPLNSAVLSQGSTAPH